MYLVGRKGFIVSAIFMLLSIAISPMTNKDGEAADTGLVVPTDVRESLCKSLFCSVVFILISGCLLINFISDSWDKSSL